MSEFLPPLWGGKEGVSPSLLTNLLVFSSIKQAIEL